MQQPGSQLPLKAASSPWPVAHITWDNYPQRGVMGLQVTILNKRPHAKTMQTQQVSNAE